ncbi:MAG: hypothetical protein GKR86_00105 [Ilumatobacter sp.]|nr:hypothetical protein [Ilumatobacter sp.]
MAGFSIADSLISSESSGNPDARIKIKDGREFFGLGQLGKARLAEVGLGKDFTMADYLTGPDRENIQRMALDRDIANTQNFIANAGLDKAYGTSINDMPFNENAAIAIAHLGGREGLRKYVDTGGQYNPQDELGTSLSDYHAKHGVGGPRVQNTPDRPSLEGFKMDMLDGANTSRQLLTTALEQVPGVKGLSERTNMRGGGGDIRPPSVFSLEEQEFQGPNLPEMPNIPPELMAEVQAAVSPNEGVTQAAAEGPLSQEAILGSVNSTIDAAREEMPGRQGIMESIGGFLFPNSDDPERQFRDTIGGIGVGLSQMSHGQPVNLQPYFNGIAQRRQAAIDSANDQEQQLFDRQMRAETAAIQRGQLGVSQQNANLAAGRLAFDIEKNGLGSGRDYSQIGDMYPALVENGTIGLAQTGDKDAQKAVVEYITNASSGAFNTPEAQEAFKKYANAPDAGARYDAIKDLPNEQQDRIVDMYSELNPDDKSPSAARLGRELYELDPDAYGSEADAIRQAARLQAGGQEGLSDEQVKQNVKGGMAYGAELSTKSSAASDRLYAIELATDATWDAIDQGKEIEALTSTAGMGIGQVIGAVMGTEKASQFYAMVGINPEQYTDLTMAQQQMMSAVARSWSGQGTISDSEREMIAREVLNTQMTNQSVVELGARLEAAALIDRGDSDYYHNTVDRTDGYSNWETVRNDIVTGKDDVQNILRSSQNQATHQYYMNENVTTEAAMKYRERVANGEIMADEFTLPQLSPNIAERYKSALPIQTINGEEYYVYFDKAGTKAGIAVNP